jgi:hypothetical protein
MKLKDVKAKILLDVGGKDGENKEISLVRKY